MSKTSDLTQLLDLASHGKASDIRDFLNLLLESKVFVPIDPGTLEGHPVPHEVGENATKSMGFLVIESGGNDLVPVFSDLKYGESWSEEKVTFEEKDFKTLLNSIDKETWLYLNPGQNVGKEFSTWEIELLRQGKDAIEEVVVELSDVSDLGVEIDATNAYTELQGQFRSVLEIYKEIKEAFLISIREGEDAPWKPLLGIYREGLSDSKVEYIREELRAIAESSLDDEIDLVVVDDLANAGSYHAKLFEDTKPFYIAQEELKSEPFSVKTLFNKVKKDSEG